MINFFNICFNKTVFIVTNSWKKNFSEPTDEQISDFCNHESLLKIVHKELKSRTCPTNLNSYDLSLQVYRESGRHFKDLQRFVFRNCSNEGENSIENIFFKRIFNDLGAGFVGFANPHFKLEEKADINSCWAAANRYLYQNGDVLTSEAKKNLKKGFAIQDINSYEDIDLAVRLCASGVGDIWTSCDFTNILNVCVKNEKYIFILVFPHLLKFLRNDIWTTLLPVFHFVSGAFSAFIQKISTYLNKGSFLLHTYRALILKKPFKVVLGTLSVRYGYTIFSISFDMILTPLMIIFPIMYDILIITSLSFLYIHSIILRFYLLSFLF